MSEPTQIESWEDLDRRLKRVGLLIEVGDLHRQERMVDHMDMLFDRIEDLEAKLAACEKYRDAYAKCDRIATQTVRGLEAKLVETICLARDVINGLVDSGDAFEVLNATLQELKGKKDE